MLWFTRRWTAGRRATFYNKEYPTSPSWGMTSRHPEEHSINPYCLRSWSSWPWLYWLLDHPYCFLKGLSCLFWNLGNWFGKRFENMSLTKSACSLCFWWPSVASSNSVEVLRLSGPHADYTVERDHNPSGDRPQFNNYFVNVVKNLGAHNFLNCEAGSSSPYRERVEDEFFATCFNDRKIWCAQPKLANMVTSNR